MNDTQITLIGNVADHPRMRITKNGHSVTNFRLASTSRRRDENGQWADTGTLWVNVTCWRALAEHAFESVKKGDPLVLTGRYYAREYKVDETTRVAYELEAVAVGHDLSRGVATFRRAIRPAPAAQVELDATGVPADRSDVWLDLAGSSETPETTEVRELASVG
jgi:single-strand DNA-binding protein